MITQSQIKRLAKDYQIDEFTIFREYLQLLSLSYLYRMSESTKIYFKGGTAIHFLFNSPRFSEDLDFSTPYDKKKIISLMKKLKREILRELDDVKITILYRGKKSIRFRLKYKTEEFKYPFTIRIDFNDREKPVEIMTSPLVTNFPIVFPMVSHLSFNEILAEKIRAFLTRGKGRDIFDIWYLRAKGVEMKQSLIVKKMTNIDKQFKMEILLDKIKTFPLRRLEADLNQFLPRQQRQMVKNLREKSISLL